MGNSFLYVLFLFFSIGNLFVSGIVRSLNERKLKPYEVKLNVLCGIYIFLIVMELLGLFYF